ncbi:hypothetical protein [Bradyrhizobium sp. McL0615]|uniref:hypothetical protein n=1 Tax=Bradyrhizobium sp. McL0615 TaxID=3415673 RepID=UPI003CF7A035
MSALQSYLTTSRRLVPEDELHAMDPYYQTLYRRVQGEMPGDLPELKVVYSTERSCEIVEADDRWYLIYDRYLGETFNLFTRILYHAKVPDYAEAAALKCIAQRLLSKNKLAEAQNIALLYSLLHPKERLTKNSFGTDRAELTEMQELFVLAHEICHHKLKHDPAFMAVHFVNAELIYLEGSEIATRKPSFTERRKLEKEYGFPVSDRFWKRTYEEGKAHWSRNKSRIIEEILCDSFALGVMLNARLAQDRDRFASLCFRAALLATRYRRILDYCDALADDIAAGRDLVPVNVLALAMMMREQCLRAIFPAAYAKYSAPDWGDENKRFLHMPIGPHQIVGLPSQIVTELNAARTKVTDDFSDLVIFRLPGLINSFRKELNVRDVVPMNRELPSDDEIFEMVERITAPNI